MIFRQIKGKKCPGPLTSIGCSLNKKTCKCKYRHMVNLEWERLFVAWQCVIQQGKNAIFCSHNSEHNMKHRLGCPGIRSRTTEQAVVPENLDFLFFCTLYVFANKLLQSQDVVFSVI